MAVARLLCAPLARRISAAMLAALLASCAPVKTTAPGVVGVERRQAMSPLVSEQDLEKGAAQAYQQVMGEARAKGELNKDPKTVQRVRKIAQRLIPQTAVFRQDAPGWAWEVNVIDSEEVNAWAMPGGKIAVYTGIIDKLKLTDDELAAIMGHEIAHALREHGRERASRAAGQGLLVSVVGAATGIGDGGQQLANMALQVAV
ncbi:MAG: M48 family metallopeptidase, partial [Burkholderiaceae bacterium]